MNALRQGEHRMKRLAVVGMVLAAACLGCAKIEVGRPRGRRHGPRPPVEYPPGPQAARDAYEPNDEDDRPSRIALGQAQAHTIGPAEDEDWIVCPTPRPGLYVIRFTHVAVELRVEVWLLRGGPRDDGDDVADFTVRRAASRQVRVRPGVRYIKLKVQAEDDDETGPYGLEIHRK